MIQQSTHIGIRVTAESAGEIASALGRDEVLSQFVREALSRLASERLRRPVRVETYRRGRRSATGQD